MRLKRWTREGLKFEKLNNGLPIGRGVACRTLPIQDILTEDVDLRSLGEIMMECVWKYC